MNAPLGPTPTSKIMTCVAQAARVTQTGQALFSGTRMTPMRDAAELEIAADNRPSSLRSGGRLQLNFSP